MKYWWNIRQQSPFGSHVLLTLGTNILLAGFGLATGILAARLLGPEGRGALAAIQTWPSFVALVGVLGLPESLVYFSAKKPQKTAELLLSGVFLSLVASIPMMAIIYAIMPRLLAAQAPEIIQASRLYLLFIPLNILIGFPIQALRGRNDISGWNGLRLLPNLAWLLVLLLALVFGILHPASLAFAYLIALLIILFPILLVVFRRIGRTFRLTTDNWKSMLRFGLPSMLSGIPQILNLRLDQMLIAALLPAHLLGLYVVALAWSSAVRPLHEAIAAVLFPRVASRETSAQQSRVYTQGSRLGILVSIPLTLLFLFLAPVLLPVFFGEAFSSAISSALLLTLAASITGINRILEEGMRGLGHPNLVLGAELAGLIISLLGLLVLLQPMGIFGAALATLLGNLTVLFVLLQYASSKSGQPLANFVLPRMDELKSIWVRIVLNKNE